MELVSKLEVRSRMQLYALWEAKRGALRYTPWYKIGKACRLRREVKDITKLLLRKNNYRGS